MSSLFISSKLCRLALATVLPARLTGSSIATGVTAPVLPTPSSISRSFVVASSGGNLYAVAHLGARAVNPNSSCWVSLFTLITFAYVLIGLITGIWSPTWIMFIAAAGISAVLSIIFNSVYGEDDNYDED